MSQHAVTALVDACVLCGPLKRNLLLALGEARLLRLHWSAEILSETRRTLRKMLQRRDYGDADERADRIVRMLDLAFPEAMVTGFSHFDSAVGPIPDEGDRHVIAAALKSKADVIVTENVRDFPRKVLAKSGLEARTTDAFLAEIVDSDPTRAVQAVERLLGRFRRCDLTPSALVDHVERSRLHLTAGCLRQAGFAEVPFGEATDDG